MAKLKHASRTCIIISRDAFGVLNLLQVFNGLVLHRSDVVCCNVHYAQTLKGDDINETQLDKRNHSHKI